MSAAALKTFEDVRPWKNKKHQKTTSDEAISESAMAAKENLRLQAELQKSELQTLKLALKVKLIEEKMKDEKPKQKLEDQLELIYNRRENMDPS